MNSKAMFSRKLMAVGIAIVSIAVVVLSIANPRSAIFQGLPFHQEIARNPISDIPGATGNVLVAKIDDTPQAHPQIGLEDADVVYIEQVEGGLTRLAAVFSSKIPTKIGPIRSARISDIDLFAQYGRVGFAYSGVQKKMRPVIDAADLVDLGAQNHSSLIYTNDESRIPPYAMVLRADLLMQFVKDRNIQLAQAKNMGWIFGAAPEGGIHISSVHLSWPASSYDAHWSKAENRWLLDHSKSPDFSANGLQLGPRTLVVQIVSITDSIYKDKVGGVTPFSATVGSGDGYILRDGKYFRAHWNRPNAQSGTQWTDDSGQPINFASGQIWVALTDKAPIFTP